MGVCQTRGQVNRSEARFCDRCGATLPGEATPAREERKIALTAQTRDGRLNKGHVEWGKFN